MIDDRDWYTMDGDLVDLKTALIEATEEPGKIVVIGTDSQRYEKREDFVTVIVVRTPFKGGRVFYTRERDPKKYKLRDKLIKEAWLSIQTAWAISPILPDHCTLAALHADVNTDVKKGLSAKYMNEICGMITGCGFQVVTKPDGFAAQHVAEHLVKNRNDKYLESKRSGTKK